MHTSASLSKIVALLTLVGYPLMAKPVDLDTLSGSWHLRVMNGYEVRKARAILDFDSKHMALDGFDGCNRIKGKLEKDPQNRLHAHLRTTRMACRQPIHKYVSRRLHEIIDGGFSIQEEKKYGVEGITLKGKKHELFFKRMGA